MADFRVSTFTPWWDEEWWPGIHDTWWDLTPFLNRLDKRKPGNGYTHVVTGKSDYIRFKIRVSPTQAVGWGSETGALPAGVNPTIDEGYGPTYNFYGRVRLTDKVMAMGDAFNIISAIDEQVQGIEKMRRARYGFQVYGDGSGALAYAHSQEAGASTTSCDVATAFGLHEGMLIDFIDATDGTTELGADKSISAIDNMASSYQTIKFDATDFSGTNLDYGDWIVDAGSNKVAMMGLDGLMNTSNPTRGNYFNINRSIAGKEFWKGLTIAVGGDLSEDHILQAVQVCVKLGYKPTAIVATQAVERYIFDELAGYRQFNKQVEGTGMVEHPTFNFSGCEVALLIDPNCTKISNAGVLNEYAYVINEDMLYLATVNDGKQWLNRDGSMFHLVNDSTNMYAMWEAGFAEYIECVCPNPRKLGVKLTGITS